MKTKASPKPITISLGPNLATVRDRDRAAVRSALEGTIRHLSTNAAVDWQELCSLSRRKLSYPRLLLKPVNELLELAGHPVMIDKQVTPTPWVIGANEFFTRRENLFAAFAEGDRGLALVESEEDEMRCALGFVVSSLQRGGTVLILAPQTRFRALKDELRVRAVTIEVIRTGQPIPDPHQQVMLAPHSFASADAVRRFSAIVVLGLKPLLVEGGYRNLMYGGGANIPLHCAAVVPVLKPLDELRLRALFRDEIGASRSASSRSLCSRLVVLPDPGGASRKRWSNPRRDEALDSFMNWMLLSNPMPLPGTSPSIERRLTRLQGRDLVVVAESCRHCRRLWGNKVWGGFAAVLPPAMARQAGLADAVVVLASHWSPFDLSSFLRPGEFRGRPAAVVLFADDDQQQELRDEGLIK